MREENESLIKKIYSEDKEDATYENEQEVLEVLQIPQESTIIPPPPLETNEDPYHFAEEIEEEETLSLHDKELELIKKSLERHKGKRKAAAEELGISERTLYRKIKQFDL